MQRQRAVHASYNSEIGLAAEHIQRNAFDAAQNILANQAKNKAQAGLRGWEWGHLSYLTKEPSIRPFELNTLAHVESVAYRPTKRGLPPAPTRATCMCGRSGPRCTALRVLADALAGFGRENIG